MNEAFNTDFANNQHQNCVKKQKVKRSVALALKMILIKIKDVMINTCDLYAILIKDYYVKIQIKMICSITTGSRKNLIIILTITKCSTSKTEKDLKEAQMNKSQRQNNNNSDYNQKKFMNLKCEPIPESSNYIVNCDEEESNNKKRLKKK